MRSAVTFVFLAMMAVVAHGQGALIATLTNPVTTPGFIPTAAGLNILGPISNTGMKYVLVTAVPVRSADGC